MEAFDRFRNKKVALNNEIRITPPQLARKWGVSPEKVRGFIKSGELRAGNFATDPNGDRPRYRIDPDDVRRFEASREAFHRQSLSHPRKQRKSRHRNVKDH